MKIALSLLALISLISCGKKIENRGDQTPVIRKGKIPFTASETWSIYSEKPLPAKVKVVINDMVFVNECKGIGRATIERTYRNGTIDIISHSAFREEFFFIDIYNCVDGSLFYSGDYVDQTPIVHPKGDQPMKIILRLRNR